MIKPDGYYAERHRGSTGTEPDCGQYSVLSNQYCVVRHPRRQIIGLSTADVSSETMIREEAKTTQLERITPSHCGCPSHTKHRIQYICTHTHRLGEFTSQRPPTSSHPRHPKLREHDPLLLRTRLIYSDYTRCTPAASEQRASDIRSRSCGG
nr:hypothetical protein CFP56_43875 [Quercus suber]